MGGLASRKNVRFGFALTADSEFSVQKLASGRGGSSSFPDLLPADQTQRDLMSHEADKKDAKITQKRFAIFIKTED